MIESSETKPRVLLTGMSGSLGQIVTQELHETTDLIGVDRRPFADKPENVELHQLDLRRKSAFTLLKKKKLDAIIHVGVIRNPHKHRGAANAYYYNLEITGQLLKLAEQLQVKKFIFLSTANLYGPSAVSPGFLSEEAPLHGANRSPEVRDLVTLDMMIQSFFWKQPTIETVILRPVHIVGPTLKNAPSRYFQLNLVPTMLGYDPMIQVVHASDVAHAIKLSLEKSVRGVFNIVGQAQAPLSRIVKAIESPSLPAPEFLMRALLRSAFRSRLSTFPPGELDHLKYTCLVNGARASKELGYKPRMTLAQTLKSLKKQPN